MSVALDAALSGLRIAQSQLNIISSNVANASTEGYTRKVLPQETQVVGGATIGVLSGPVVRKVDMNVQKDVWTQVSAASFYDVQTTYMSQIQSFNGPPDKELSIAATIAQLQNDFVQLSNTPDDQAQQHQTVLQAQAVAKKFNDYSELVNQMRNDTQAQILNAVSAANTYLSQIAQANQQIKFATATGTTTAAMSDQRDTAIRKLSELIGITSFTRGDGVLVVQTTQGQQLADENASPLYFNPTSLSASSFYPNSAAPLYVGGDPASNPGAPDITTIGVGGQIGAYLEMRDSTLPRYQAQLDEMAQKMAMRMNAQGVKLFTDISGAVPSNADPVIPTTGPATPVAYVGFASQIKVNDAIVRDNSLLQKSTLSGVSVQAGSSEFLRRIVDYAFGANEYQQASGTVDLRVSAGVAPNNTLQNVLGLDPSAQLVGSADIRTVSSGVPLNQATGNPFLPPSGPPLLDDFTLRFDAGGTNDTGNITIDLTAVDAAFPTPPAASGAAALVSYLNTNVIPGLGAPLDSQISASLNQFGQLIINSQVAIDVGAGNMGTSGLNFLGLTAGSTAAQSPYFEIQVGKDNPVRIDIDPGDDETDLLTKLNNVPGVQASISSTTGRLTVRPGPNFGGDLRIVSGSIQASGGNSVVKQLFGSDTPVVNVANAAFRTDNLGPGANISTGVAPAGSIIDYAQRVISTQAQDANNATSKQQDESSYRDLIEKSFKGSSGVNLDEELSQLIVVQTAYAASAKTIATLDEMFQQLLNSV